MKFITWLVLAFLLAVLTFSYNCKKIESNHLDKLPPSTHKCFLENVRYSDTYHSEVYSYNEDKMVRKIVSNDTRIYRSTEMFYDTNNRLIKIIQQQGDGDSKVDTTVFLYENDILYKTTTKEYYQPNGNLPCKLLNTKEMFFSYESNGNKIKTTISKDGELMYREQLYENEKMLMLTEFDNNHLEIERFILEHDTINRTVEITRNGEFYRKIWFDYKNCPEITQNIYDSKNLRMFNFSKPFYYFYPFNFLKGYLLSYHNPKKIVQGGNTLLYEYTYNEYDYPIECIANKTMFGGNSILDLSFSYDCAKK